MSTMSGRLDRKPADRAFWNAFDAPTVAGLWQISRELSADSMSCYSISYTSFSLCSGKLAPFAFASLDQNHYGGSLFATW